MSFASGEPVITVQSLTDVAGATVDVNVSIEDNPGILGAKLTFTYDTNLTLVGANAGEAFSALTMTKPGGFVSPCNFTWDAQEITEEDIKDGTVLTLTFKIPTNATPGTSYSINASYDDGDFVDTELNAVSPSIVNGGISVVDFLPGDLDGNNKINTTDISIDVIIMVGIAGGIPSPEDKEKHVRLGDIVIAKEVISYDFVSERTEFEELRGRSVPPSARLMEAQSHLDVGKLMGDKPWEKYIDEISQKYPQTFARPSDETDVLYDIQGNPIIHPEDPNRNDYPYIFKEKIASANRVLKNPLTRDKLKKQYSVYAAEMEGSGISEATWQLEIGYYVVRGISDYCDGKKNDVWHNYAALVAAAYTRSLIEKLPY